MGGMLDGKTIIPRAHDPEHEAARWLRDHGYTGAMETAQENGRSLCAIPIWLKRPSGRSGSGGGRVHSSPLSTMVRGKGQQAAPVRRRTPAGARRGT